MTKQWLVQELPERESLDLLARTSFGRIASAQGAQPYVVPFYFTYDNYYLYSFSTVGRKIECMRANPRVCVETDEVVSSQQWVSIVVFGLYEELPDTPTCQQERAFAHSLLQKRAMWWEPGCETAVRHSIQRQLALSPLFYRIRVVQISGHRAGPEPAASTDTKMSRTESGENGWLRRILRHIRVR
jgi:nitroimidazol reductase NimA-like FMN-containing flavoprotein (pyridoxamine 5'-phosphate oxidase superfamily)